LGDGAVLRAAETAGRDLAGPSFLPCPRHFPSRDEQPEEPRVTTPTALADRPSSHLDPADAAAELSLAALLEFFAAEEPVSARRTLRSSAARFGAWLRTSSRRAASWGAVPTAAGVRTETAEVQ
jgi:hypothetical protein